MTDRNPLDDLPRIHPRTTLVQVAEADIGLAIIDLAVRHEVTYAELLEILGRQIVRWAQHQIRHERGERRHDENDEDE